MLEIQKKQLSNIKTMLIAMKCQFAIVTPDGVKIGDLEVAPPEGEKKRRSPKRSFAAYNIHDQVRAMKVGDVLVIKPLNNGDGITASMIAGNMSGCACHHFGNGNFTTCSTPTHAEGMRTG
jgi:hypothetical protein